MPHVPPPSVKSLRRLRFLAIRVMQLSVFVAAAAALPGCIDNATHPDLQPWLPPGNGAGLIGCTPNLDGILTSAELQAAIGVPARYRLAFDQSVDPQGQVSAAGKRSWDWGWSSAGEQVLTIAAENASDKWYASKFPGAQFTTVFDLEGKLDAVYRKDDKGLWLLGLVSRQAKPAGGLTLMAYDPPVLAVQLPLQAGDAWTSVGTIKGGSFNGLPYAGTDTYSYRVAAAGALVLPDLAIDQALQLT